MSKILFAWELGSGYGHLNRMLPVAAALRTRGHEVVFALRDVSRAEVLLGGTGFTYLQSPVWLPRPAHLPPTVNYSGVLAHAGWLDPTGLAGLLRAWRALYAALAPALILIDHGPTALLAARGLTVPRACVGNGFEIPPALDPLPPLAWWDPPSEEQLRSSDAAILASANQALAYIRAPALRRLSDILFAHESFLCVPSEMDQYSGRGGDVRYWGSVYRAMGGAPPRWPGVAGRKIFAYVNPEYVDFDRLLTSLKLLAEPVLVHAPGVSDAARRRFSCPSLAFSALPLDMEEVTATASLVVAHSAIGAGQTALSRGVPVLLLPTHMEQLMAARRVQELGGGLSVFPKEKKVDYRKVLGRLLDEPSFSAAARGFADRHGVADPRARADAIAIRCDELIVQASGAAAGGL